MVQSLPAARPLLLLLLLFCQALSVPLLLLAATTPACREQSIRESHPEGPQLQQALATFRQVGAAALLWRVEVWLLRVSGCCR